MWNARMEVWCSKEANPRAESGDGEWKSELWLRVSEAGLQVGGRRIPCRWRQLPGTDSGSFAPDFTVRTGDMGNRCARTWVTHSARSIGGFVFVS